MRAVRMRWRITVILRIATKVETGSGPSSRKAAADETELENENGLDLSYSRICYVRPRLHSHN